MGASSIARLVTLPIGALAVGITTYLTVSYVGGEQYGFIALVAMLFQLIPFADLGLGAAVTNAVATHAVSEQARRDMLQTTRRVMGMLAFVSLGLVSFTGVVSLLHGWSPLLGLGDVKGGHVDLAVFLALTPFLVSVPLGVGQRLLVGDGRSKELAYVSALGPLLATTLTWVGIEAKIPALFLSMAPSLGVLLVSAVCLRLALMHLGTSLRQLLGASPSAAKLQPLRTTAIPYLIISIGIPIAVQSDRLVLAHQSTPSQLAIHAVGTQLYTPCFSVISAGSLVLWPLFLRNPDRVKQLWHQALRYLGVLGAVLSCGYLAFAGIATTLISGGRIQMEADVAMAFASLIMVMSVHQASAMLLTSPTALRFQAKCVSAMVLINLPLSITLAGPLGAAGPVLASALAIFIAQLLPGIFRARQLLSSAQPISIDKAIDA